MYRRFPVFFDPGCFLFGGFLFAVIMIFSLLEDLSKGHGFLTMIIFFLGFLSIYGYALDEIQKEERRKDGYMRRHGLKELPDFYFTTKGKKVWNFVAMES